MDARRSRLHRGREPTKKESCVRIVLPDAIDSFTIPKFSGKITVSNHDLDPRDDDGREAVGSTPVPATNTRSASFTPLRTQTAIHPSRFEISFLEATQSAVTNFTEWIWVRKGQVWNAPSGEYPRQISPVSFFDVDDGTGGKEVGAKPLSIRRHSVVDRSQRPEDLDEISRLCVEDGGPSLAELLLAEAGHYLWKPERLAPRPSRTLGCNRL